MKTVPLPDLRADELIEIYAGADPATRCYWSSPCLRAVGIDRADEARGTARGGIAFGGIAFNPNSGHWPGFPARRLHTPAVTIVADSAGVRALVADDADLDRALARRRAPGKLRLGDPSDHDPAYLDLVRRSVKAIDAGELAKVVLARRVELSADGDGAGLVADLQERFGPPTDCAVFAFGSPEGTFVGASPEPLVQIRGRRFTTVALAGSRPRSTDPAADKRLGDELRESEKDLAEHRFVIDAIAESLTGIGVELDPIDGPQVVRLPNIFHLRTPIRGTVPPGVDALDLVDALHPSPAVGGVPTSAALDWIDRHEGLDRGWYAAPVGWIAANGDAEFRVGLRSGLLRPGQLSAFVGAGIVAGSDPEQELAETRTKLVAILDR